MHGREAIHRGFEMGQPKASFVQLQVVSRDGGLYVTSPRIPGLHVFGRDLDVLLGELKAAAEQLLEHNQGLRVEAYLGAEGPDNDPSLVDAGVALSQGNATLVLVQK